MTVLAFAPPGTRLRVPPPDDLPSPELIAFRPGQSIAAVQGGAVRGDWDLYTVVARAGQTLSVAVEDTEGNAALELYEPGVRVGRGPWGLEFHGNSLTEPDGADVDCWTGELPRTGPYLIAVGTTRGNASYRLSLCLE
jgi:hypothetical protein